MAIPSWDQVPDDDRRVFERYGIVPGRPFTIPKRKRTKVDRAAFAHDAARLAAWKTTAIVRELSERHDMSARHAYRLLAKLRVGALPPPAHDAQRQVLTHRRLAPVNPWSPP